MSIQEHFNKINPKRVENGSNREFPDVETVSFDENGEIESKSLFKKLFFPFLMILVLSLAFGLGRLSTSTKNSSVTIELDKSYSTTTGVYNIPTAEAKTKTASSTQSTPIINSAVVVGSAKSTKYHYLYCPGAKQISEANKITFTNAAAAEAAGYTLALNCKPR